MAVELRQVRAFVEVSSEKHFGRAAAKLNMTQPAVTQRIHALERELGVELLTRSARAVGLTRSGEYFLPYAVRLVQIADQAQRDLRSAAGGGGSIRIGYLANVEIAAPVSIVREFRRRHPSIELITDLGDTRLNIEQVATGDVDLAFVATKGNLPGALAYRRVALGELVLAVPAGHRFPAGQPVDPKELGKERLILFPPHLNPTFSDGVISWLNRHTKGGFTVEAHEPFEHAVESVARSGHAIALVPRQFAMRISVDGVVFRSLSAPPIFEIGAIFRRDNPAPALAKLIRVVDEACPPAPFAEPDGGELIG